MTFREFIENINKFAEQNPETLDMQVITSKDDEGNGFNHICYEPSKGIFEDWDFIPFEQYKDWERNDSETNAVCIN